MRIPVCILVLLIALFGAASAWLGPDASWDLRNYHLYVAHAALAGTLWSDIAPAQLQSFYNPDLDIAPFLLRRALNAHPVILDFVLAVPHAVAVWLVIGITRNFVPRPSPGDSGSSSGAPASPRGKAGRDTSHFSRFAGEVGAERRVRAENNGQAAPRLCLSLLCALFGASGAASLPTLGTSMSEMVPACLFLAALYLFCASGEGTRGEVGGPVMAEWCPRLAGMTEPGAAGAAGILTGLAVGMKLATAPYALGLLAGLLAGRPRSIPLFLAASALALLAVAAPWWSWLWAHTGNPLFPYFNDFFRSPWTSPTALTDTRFLPHGLLRAAFFPALWAFQPSMAACELPVRDPRLLLGAASCLFLSARALMHGGQTRRQTPPMTRLFLAFWTISLAAWEIRFGVLRYAALLELLSGIPVALALATLWRQAFAVRALALLTAAVIAVTIYPDWGRAKWTALAAEVHPPFQAGSLVLLLDPAPMAYVAAFSPPGVRFAGANNNLVHPGDSSGLSHAIGRAIAGQHGPLWGLESPAEQPAEADRALAFYGLERGMCVRLRSTLDADALLACRLRRLSPLPASAGSGRRAPPGPG